MAYRDIADWMERNGQPSAANDPIERTGEIRYSNLRTADPLTMCDLNDALREDEGEGIFGAREFAVMIRAAYANCPHADPCRCGKTSDQPNETAS